MQKFAFLLVAFLAALVNAQTYTCPGSAVYVQCKRDIATLESTTCSLLASNSTFFNQCLCYVVTLNSRNCGAQCPNDVTATQEINTNLANVTTLCTAASLNPASLPAPPPWQQYFPSASGFNSGSNSVTGTNSSGSTTTTTTNKSSAFTSAVPVILAIISVVALFL